jgi:DNA repair exonuclease SbcCD ATPase subunit
MNILPVSLKLVNFLSHSDTTLSFQEDACLVLGDNRDDAEMPSNGAGKTALPNALLYVLTGKTFDGSRGDSIIREGQSSCEVRFDFLRSDGKKGFVCAKRHPNKVLFHDGDAVVQCHSILETRKKILEFFGLDFEVLTRFIIVGESEQYKFSFLSSDDEEKKKLLTKLTDSSVIDRAHDFVMNKFKQHEEKYQRVDTEVSVQLDELAKEKVKQAELIEELQQVQRSNNSLRLRKLEKQYRKYKKKALLLKQRRAKELAEWRLTEQKHAKRSGELVGRFNGFAKTLEEEREELHELKLAKAKIVVCPNCNFEINEGELSFKKINQLLVQRKKAIVILQDSKDSLEQEHDLLLVESERQAKMFSEHLDLLEKGIEFAKQRASELHQRLEIERVKGEARVEGIQRQVKDLEERSSLRTTQIRSLVQERRTERRKLALNKKFKHYFGKDGFKNFLFNRKLKTLEVVVNSILTETKANIQVEIYGMTKLKSGRYNQKISGSAIINGRKRDFRKLSKGERRRVDMAFILAFGRLLNLRSPLMLRIFDEPFSGLDERGKKRVVEMLKGLGMTTLVLTPEKELVKYFDDSKVLIVAKKDSESRLFNYIEYQPEELSVRSKVA